MANGALELLRVELALDEIIGGAGAHGFAVHLVIAQAGEQDDGGLTTMDDGSAQQLEAVAFAEAVINQINVVPVLVNGLQARVVVFHPLQLEIVAADFGEEFPRQDVIVLVILDQQHFQTRIIHGGRRAGGPAVQRFQTSICRGPS